MVQSTTSILMAALASTFVIATPVDFAEATSDNSNVTVLTGPCFQGGCPDNTRYGFDMVYTDESGYTSDYIRVEDCQQCIAHKTGNGGGGCFDFKTCGHRQTICVDPRNFRAHRIWRDNGDKSCYGLEHRDLGACGGTNIRNREVFSTINQRRC